MVSFEHGKEIEKDVFSSCHEHGTKKNTESEFFLCPTLATRRKNIFLYE